MQLGNAAQGFTSLAAEAAELAIIPVASTLSITSQAQPPHDAAGVLQMFIMPSQDTQDSDQ